jgi:hypothetical protein
MNRQPLPWSYSALNLFTICQYAYFEQYVTKRTKKTETEKKDWGKLVHTAFEDYVDSGGKIPLPPSLKEHQGYVDKVVMRHEGILFTEMQGALDRQLMPVSEWYDKSIWFRVVLDVLRVIRGGDNALIVDWKTGKMRDGMEKQNMLFAIFVWHLFPNVDICDTRLYFTETGQELRKVYGRAQEEELWDHFLPDLKQYRDAFKQDIWQKRPGWKCKGHCDVKDCEHWQPLRQWRRR